MCKPLSKYKVALWILALVSKKKNPKEKYHQLQMIIHHLEWYLMLLAFKEKQM